jgi:hypothetical protein
MSSCAKKNGAQIDMLHVESDFYKAVHDLECKFQPQFDALNNKVRFYGRNV